MAIARDSSYGGHAPSDIQKLVSELEKREGIDIPEPVWTVGRLDERASRAAPSDSSEAEADGQIEANAEGEEGGPSEEQEDAPPAHGA